MTELAMRRLTVAAAQMGPVGADDSRADVVDRMLALLREARQAGVRHLVFPELALTTFFPRDYHESRADVGRYFERSMPGPDTQPLFDFAAEHRIGFVLGYAEETPEGARFNSAALVDEQGCLAGIYRKVHVPGTSDFDPSRAWQQLERRYFQPGDLGFPAWELGGVKMGLAICNDRRWPESFRVLGLQDVDVVSIGYCTPLLNTQFPEKESVALRQLQSDLTLQAAAYHNSCYVVAAAKAGVEEGCAFQAGSLIAAPTGEIIARASTDADELVVAELDLEACEFYRNGIMRRSQRRVDAYGPITRE